MPLWSLTFERVEDLLKSKDAKLKDIDILTKIPANDLWINDMSEFVLELEAVEEQEEQDRLGGLKIKRKAPVGNKGKGKNKNNKEEDPDSENEIKKKKAPANKAKAEKKNEKEETKNPSANVFVETSQKIKENNPPVDMMKLTLKQRIAFKGKI